jgi:hypothetical protein
MVLSLPDDSRKWRGGVVTDLSEIGEDHWVGWVVYSGGGMSYEDAHCFHDWGEFCLHIIVAAFDAGSGSGAPSGSGAKYSGSGNACYAGASGDADASGDASDFCYASHSRDTGGSGHASIAC